jgi:hypothetical protein
MNTHVIENLVGARGFEPPTPCTQGGLLPSFRSIASNRFFVLSVTWGVCLRSASNPNGFRTWGFDTVLIRTICPRRRSALSKHSMLFHTFHPFGKSALKEAELEGRADPATAVQFEQSRWRDSDLMYGLLLKFRIADLHDKSVSREKRILLTRATEERVTPTLQNPQLAIVPLGEGSCLTQNQTSICCLGPMVAFTED